MSDENNQDVTQGKGVSISGSNLLKLAIPLVLTVSALVIYNFYSVASYQKMSQDIRTSMFNDKEINAVLLTYRTNDDIKELTINATGVKGELTQYEEELITFVCSSEFLLSELAANHQVQVKLIAKLRKQDKYLDVNVKSEQCSKL